MGRPPPLSQRLSRWVREMSFDIADAPTLLTSADLEQLTRGKLAHLWEWLLANIQPQERIQVRPHRNLAAP